MKRRDGAKIRVRKGQGSVRLDFETYKARFEAFFGPAFENLGAETELIVERSWAVYDKMSPSEEKAKAGAGAKHPEFEVSREWLEASRRLKAAERERARATRTRILLINGSPRSDNTCPQEMSKTHRLCELAKHSLAQQKIEVEYLDLSRLTSEYGKRIHPCKACVSTAMPLCHWPCSCYPNHRLGQVQDWMADIYEMWVRAHGVMIVTPVHWYAPPSVLKLMMDRLVCADGGNPDVSSTKGKTPELAKKLELAGWDFPKHLAGRV